MFGFLKGSLKRLKCIDSDTDSYIIIVSCVLYNITIDNVRERELLENEGLVNENVTDEENVPDLVENTVGNMAGATKREEIAHTFKCKVIIVFLKYNFQYRMPYFVSVK